MSFATAHNAYLDPDRHLWPDDEPETDDTSAIQDIRDMVAEFETPFRFYRTCYKETPCGPTIGMRFDNGPWVYSDDLPKDEDSVNHITAIGASSIVEGLEAATMFYESFTPEEFWLNLK